MRVNDRGPFVKGRIIDLSYAAAKALGVVGPGTAPVHIEALGYQQTGTPGQVVYRQPASYDVGHFAVQVGAFTVAANADRLAPSCRAATAPPASSRARSAAGSSTGSAPATTPPSKPPRRPSAQYERGGYPNSFVVAME